MFNIILAVHIIVAIVMIGLILIQHGKGADAGASFGAGSSGTIFGASGSANFITRLTTVLAIIFFSTSLILAFDARKQSSDKLMLDEDVATESLFLDSNTSNTETVNVDTELSSDEVTPSVSDSIDGE